MRMTTTRKLCWKPGTLRQWTMTRWTRSRNLVSDWTSWRRVPPSQRPSQEAKEYFPGWTLLHDVRRDDQWLSRKSYRRFSVERMLRLPQRAWNLLLVLHHLMRFSRSLKAVESANQRLNVWQEKSRRSKS